MKDADGKYEVKTFYGNNGYFTSDPLRSASLMIKAITSAKIAGIDALLQNIRANLTIIDLARMTAYSGLQKHGRTQQPFYLESLKSPSPDFRL